MSKFAEAAHGYLAQGWSPIPLPPNEKAPPPDGFTGKVKDRASGADIQDWIEGKRYVTKKETGASNRVGNIGIVMPDNVVGIDIDHYGDKTGRDTIAALTPDLGELPATWVSSSRDHSVTGIHFYLVPEGRSWKDLHDVEVIHSGYRYAVAAPSVHPKTGEPYHWLDETTGEVTDTPPNVADLPELPASWVAHLDKGQQSSSYSADLDGEQVSEMLAAMPQGEPCHHVTAKAGQILTLTPTSRHAGYTATVMGLVSYGRRGCPGVLGAITRLGKIFAAELSGPEDAKRGQEPPTREYRRMVVSALGVVASEPQGATCSDDVSWIDQAWEWDPLLKLGEVGNLPDWPRGCLPPAAEAMVEAVAAHVQVDRRLIGSSALGILSGTVARVAMADAGHTEPLNLWTNAIAETGERKSAALRVLAAPVSEYERHKNEETAVVRARNASDAKVAQKALERAESDMAKANNSNAHEKARQERDIQQEKLGVVGRTEPTHYACNNGTVEAMCKLMADNDERVLLVAAEPGFLSVMAGQYSKKSAELAPILDAHSGDGGLDARITRDSVSLTNPALSMVISSQPSRLADLFAITDATEQGLAGRFLFSMCRTQAGYRNPAERVPIPEAVERGWSELVASLLDLTPAQGKAPSVEFSSAALDLWQSWHWEEVEMQQRPGGILNPQEVRGFGSKLAGAVVRISGVLHMCEHVDRGVQTKVSRETVAKAIQIGRYFLAHGVAAHTQGGQSETQKVARRIVDYGERQGWAEFTARKVSNALGVGKDARDLALHELADRAYIRELPKVKSLQGGRPSERYVWNPELGKRAPVVLSDLSYVSTTGEVETQEVAMPIEAQQDEPSIGVLSVLSDVSRDPVVEELGPFAGEPGHLSPSEQQEVELLSLREADPLAAGEPGRCGVCGQPLGKAAGYSELCSDCREEASNARPIVGEGQEAS